MDQTPPLATIESPSMVETAPAVAVQAVPAARRPLRWYNLKWWFTNFLVVSIIAHIFFGLIATYFVVQVITAKRKQDFAPGPSGPSAPSHALEHKVSMAKKQQTMSAPTATKRITTTSMSKVSLPALPAMPMTESVVPASMSGMGGTGLSPGFGTGGAGGGAGGGGKGMNMFGSFTGGTGLAGTFYDLKQDKFRRPTPRMDPGLYGNKIVEFVKGGFNLGSLANYFRSPRPLYATQIFTPDIDANLGPAAFNLQNEVQPRMWCVHYKGKVRAPETGAYHFVGMGDDLLLVKFDGRLVLDACWSINCGLGGQSYYHYNYSSPSKGFTKGPVFNVEAGHIYPMEVVIGEQPGGRSCAALLIEKEGVEYQKDNRGNPLLPVFRMSSNAKLLPPPPNSRGYAPHAEVEGPVWAGTPDTMGTTSLN